MIDREIVEAVDRLLAGRGASEHERREAIRLTRSFLRDGYRLEEAAPWGVMFALHEWAREGASM